MDASFWCEDCGRSQDEECKLHEVIRIKDRVVQTYARLTLPHVLNVKVVEFRAVGAHVHGVYPKKIIQKRTQFGPLVAPTSAKKVPLEQKICLKVFASPTEYGYVNFSSEEDCSWMMFIRPAKTLEEQNMVAYQHMGKIFYSTTKVIPPGKELKVWYTADYAKMMRKKLLSQMMEDVDNFDSFNSDDDTSDNDGCSVTTEEPPQLHEVLLYDCSVCKATFTDMKFFEAHTCSKVQKQKEPLAVKELIEDHIDECANEDDSRSDDSPHKRNKRKGNPVKLSKAGRVIKPREQANVTIDEDSPDISKAKETRRRRSKRLKVAKTDAENDVNEPVVADKVGVKDNNHAILPVVNVKRENVAETVSDQENDDKVENVKKPRKGKKLHTCDVCSKCYPSANRLKIHQYVHTGERPFRCEHETCGKAFTSKFKLDRHMLIHKPKSKTHSCPHCDMSFYRKDHLKNHLKVHDPNKPVHTCEKCGREYYTSFAFRTHMGFHHAEEGSLTCSVCGQVFIDKDKLVYHLKVHAGAQSVKGVMQRKQKCPHCDKKFYTQKDVRRHVIVHTREKDFLCQYCPQRFGRRDHLTRHLRKAHTGSESYLMTFAKQTKVEEQQEELPLPADLKSCKVEATVPPMDYQPVQQIHDLVISTSQVHTNMSGPHNDLAQTAQQLLDTCQRGIQTPPPQSNPTMTAQISPNTQYVYLRNAIPSNHQYLPISSNSLSPLSGVPLQSIPISLPNNTTQPVLAKLDSKPFDNLVSTLVPMLNIQCSPVDEKITTQDLGLAVVQGVVADVPDRDQNATLLAHASLPHRDLTLPSPPPPSVTIDPDDHRFFAPNSHIDPDKLNLPISSPAMSATDLDYAQSSQVLDKLPEVCLSDRRLFIPGGHLEDIKLSDGQCIITEAQLASYVETLKVLGNLPHIPTGNGYAPVTNCQATSAESVNTVASMNYTQALPEFTHSFQ